MPEEWEDWAGKEFVRRRFSNDSIASILDQWEGLRSSSKGISLYRHRPFEVWFLAWLWDYNTFDSFGLNVETSYVQTPSGLAQFMDVSKKLYELLTPAYGSTWTLEMRRKVKSGSADIVPGPLPHRDGLQDIDWANFFGPEYVEMFGLERVLSAPCHRVERLVDGGAVLILTESPLDFEKNPDVFNRKRDLARFYLGEDAFFMGYDRPASRFPKFRFWDERQNLIQQSLAKMPKAKPASATSLKRAKHQLEHLTQLAEALKDSVRKPAKSASLDYTSLSLDDLDSFLSTEDFAKSEELELRLAAYLGMSVQKRFGGKWSVDRTLGTPALDIPKLGEALPQNFEPFGGLAWSSDLENVPDVLVDEKLVRIWPFAKVRRLLRSEISGHDFRAYVNAIEKGLEMKRKTLIRIP